jgi:hypothetical protein
MKEPRIQVIVKEPLQDPQLRTIDNTLEAMQDIVQGRIEIVHFDPHDRVELVCNEEFLFQAMEPNVFLPAIDTLICGPLFLAAPENTPEGVQYRSLSAGEAADLMRLLG